MAIIKYSPVIILPTGERYEFEKFTELEYDEYENAPGRIRFAVPITDPKLDNLVDVNKFLRIHLYRNGVLCWQGFVAFISDDINKTTFYGLGYLECFKWYRVGWNTAYSGKKLGTEIISPIWDAIDGRSGAILGDLIKKGTIEDPYTTSTTTAKTITRTVFDEDFFTLCQQMIAIARSNSPTGSWIQNTVMKVSLSETAPTFSFLRNVGSDKPLAIFELDSEISDFLYTQDLRYIRNDVKGLGIISGPKVIDKTETDSTSRGLHYLREISNLFDSLSSQSELDEQTKDYLKQNKDPDESWYLSFTSKKAPYDGYLMGDSIKVRINRGRVSLDSYFRVIGMEVIVTDSGAEIPHPILEGVRT